MTRFTVLYTCVRGYKCFRSVLANNETAACAKVVCITPNIGTITDAIPFVGNY